MDITDMRQNILVYTFTSHSGGCTIHYIINKTQSTLILDNIKLFAELVAIGSLDYETQPEEFADYNISQWDAINLAIRRELSNEIESDIDNSDIGKSIEKIKNK